MRNKLNIHIPDGVNDILSYQYDRLVENKLLNFFASWGYQAVSTPTFEFYDVFAGHIGLISQESMIKFFDKYGRILTLRPEMTMAMARLTATKMQHLPMPVRLCYLGSAFRADEPHKEFTQAGVEIYGDGHWSSDTEILSLAIHALLELGLTDFQFELGQVNFFKGLVSECRLSHEQIVELSRYIDCKDTVSISDLLSDLPNIDREIADILIKLPNLFGDVTLLEQLMEMSLPQQSATAVLELKKIYARLERLGLAEYISFDMGMLQSLNYYSGAIYRGVVHGVPFPICSGGRYDHAMHEFGSQLKAAGIAFHVSHIISAMTRRGLIGEKSKNGYLVSCDKEDNQKLVFDLCQKIRANGNRAAVVMENVYEYALQHDYLYIVWLQDGMMITENVQSRVKTQCAPEEWRAE